MLLLVLSEPKALPKLLPIALSSISQPQFIFIYLLLGTGCCLAYGKQMLFSASAAEGIQVVRALRNVEVVAPSEAQFECEISAPPAFSPQWSLNGEELHPGSEVKMESVGHVHRLRLCQTVPGMSGMVKVTLGNARSKAHLTVRGTSAWELCWLIGGREQNEMGA